MCQDLMEIRNQIQGTTLYPSSVLSQIKEKVVHASDKPQEVYKSMVTDGNKVSGKYQSVLNPRNAKQI